MKELILHGDFQDLIDEDNDFERIRESEQKIGVVVGSIQSLNECLCHEMNQILLTPEFYLSNEKEESLKIYASRSAKGADHLALVFGFFQPSRDLDARMLVVHEQEFEVKTEQAHVYDLLPEFVFLCQQLEHHLFGEGVDVKGDEMTQNQFEHANVLLLI